MNPVNTLQGLGLALKKAASEGDWIEVERVDARLAEFLTQLKGTGQNAALRQTLEAVRQLHQKVLDCAQVESDLLEQKMALTRRNREGASAYASFMDAEELG
jgi:enoyl-CoA hydratase/carnithine racemase